MQQKNIGYYRLIMLNSLGRVVPDTLRGYTSATAYQSKNRILIPEKAVVTKPLFLDSISAIFDEYHISDGMTLSFHHHLRNGDGVLNAVCQEIKTRGIKHLTIAPSSIFPNNAIIVDLIIAGNITNIRTNYINGPAARPIDDGKLQGLLLMDTHGGRARAIESGDLPIDIAILACPTVDRNGNGSGTEGLSACGTLGYAQSDLRYAKKVILVTDTIVDKVKQIDLDGKYVDAIVQIDSIGDPEGIVSGTTKITKDPVGLKIARDAADFLYQAGVIKPGFSMQTGAGGTSLAVAAAVRKMMITKQIHGSFASGGTNGYYTDLLKEGWVDNLYDVQCFDLEAVRSYRDNSHHIAISASKYGNPYEPNPVVNNLSFVALGATEIDLDFNVNVTTDSLGRLIGGSGGHADTAHGADITIITTTLAKARLPIIKEHVTTITTPGEDVDVLVTERGIAINPRRVDLLEKMKNSNLTIMTISELMAISHQISGIPAAIKESGKVTGLIVYRDGTILDQLYQRF
ncbi:MAG: citrate lyase subunit alpha [Candidatus Izemoplasmatales bacterium]|nr:citrate lyase subunit alpha [Candidatus Izemoplasmatales bacterium]